MNSTVIGVPASLQIDNPESRVYDTKRHKSVFITLILNWWSQLIRQDLPSVWDPRPSVFRSVLFFAILSFITVPLASTIIWQTHQNTEIILRYDSYIDSNKTLDNNIRKQQILNNSGSGILITNTLTIREDLESPVYVYYELKDFYQNHKRYVRSVEFEQIGKGNISASDLSVCKPYRLIPGNGSTDERVINPCGLLAHSYFNDTFKLQSSWTSDVADLGLKMKETGIATEWDRKYLYGDHEAKNFNEDVNTRGGGQIEGPLNEDEHFMVWMKVGSRPTVRKLYGIIESDIPKGAHLTFEIQNRYNTYDFSGEKRLILSTANWTGGRDIFTGILFFVIGGMSALACLVILFVDRRVNREAGDIRALSWERKKN
eukprot:g6954.t2